jgi:uncharacterized protein (TIGR03086 family)
VNVPDLHRRACDEFGKRVDAVADDQWHRPTPCSDWDVRTLVNHIVAESLWTPPLMEGRTIKEVGDRFDGDVVGGDPRKAFHDAATPAIEAISSDGAMSRTVHLSFGDTPALEYAMQLFADYLIHGWDLARATGGEERLDPELVAACSEWFKSMEDAYRTGGAIGPRPDVPADADPQTELLARFGRTSTAPGGRAL